MRSAELRERYLTFFERQGHTRVESDALIPSGDPTVLFTSAGMNQFKDAFLGKRTDLTRATSCQKCLRAGDLDRVGQSPSHHTFFEMLGNFSFGDYFKKEAIQWAWEFLTGTKDFAGTTRSASQDLCLSFPAGRLWVSIYEEDDEAFQLWRQLGVPEERIVRFGQEDNFWPSNAPKDGPNGPCGPCSEIYYDVEGKVNGPKSVEVWNLVFTQFNRLDGGKLEPLPRKNIDTGMGLERLTRVAQGVETDYETDLFVLIMQRIKQLSKSSLRRTEDVAIAERVVADHIRAILFLLTEGILPSNESRGYILRMLIRRACLRFDKATGVGAYSNEISYGLAEVTDAAAYSMVGSPYAKQLGDGLTVAKGVLAKEISQFQQTLEAGTNRLTSIIAALRKRQETVIPGPDAFELYDTYGLPVELTADLANERGLTVDFEGFRNAMETQRERSRASSQLGKDIFQITQTIDSNTEIVARRSEFIGYDQLETDARVNGIWKAGQWADAAEAGDEVGLILDRSPFYGEAGGQVGDHGAIDALHGRLDVIDTKWIDTLLVHYVKVREGRIKVNEPVKARVDAQRRTKVARSHTAAHLLHWALRSVLGPETVQAGSFVETERVRFDFSSMKGLHEEQRAQVEQLVNRQVMASDPVKTDVMRLDEAKKAGALALFGEKYGQQVRVVSIGDYSRELCGGTHLHQTSSVGVFKIIGESSVAAGTRRVEALVGEAASGRQQQESQWLGEIAQRLSRPPQDALLGLEELMGQLRAAHSELKALKGELAHVRGKQLAADAQRIGEFSVIIAQIGDADRELLAALADSLRGTLGRGVAVLASVPEPSQVAWVMAATDDAVKRGVHAGKLLKQIAAVTQGGGGGRPDFAQAGGKDVAKIPEALETARALVAHALEGK